MAQTTPLILILDQGSHASRAMLYDLKGRAIDQYSVALEPDHPDPIRSEYPANAPYETLRRCIDQVLAATGNRRILAAALACQRSSIACWDREDGSPLSPVISWQDRRTGRDIGRWHNQAAYIRERTGLRLSPHYGASKLRWCIHNLPEVATAAARKRLACGPLSSRLISQLTREHRLLVDPANAARTLLIDRESGDWSPRLIDLFGLPTDCLPACVPSEYDFGHIPAPQGDIPLMLVTGDQAAALYAHGPLRPDTLYATLGTGAFLIQPTSEWVISDPLLTGMVHDDGRRRSYALEGTINGAGSALQWFKRSHYANGTDSDELEKDLPNWLAERLDPPLFLNGVHGLGTPFMGVDLNLTSRFIPSDNNPSPDIADQAVAVIESVVFLLEENRRTMAQSANMAGQILICGGLSRLDGLCQRLADITGLPVRRSQEPETTSRGLAFLLTRHLTGRDLIQNEEDHPDNFPPTANETLHDRFAKWQAAMREALTHG